MLVVAVIVIKLFQQQASHISQISNTEKQQAVSECVSACQNSYIDFCSKYVSIGNGIVEPQPGYYLCANSVPCSVALQLYGGNNQCEYQGYPVSPLDCMYLECQNYIDNLQYDSVTATSLVFGNYSPATIFNATTLQENIYFSTPSQLLYPGPQACSSTTPTWITNQVFLALLKVLDYYNTNYNCTLNLNVTNEILYVVGNCPALNMNGNTPVPLCQFLLNIPYPQLNSIS
ncbi:hypothetical protein YN1_4470 [Nanoarchaeota archaeon]